MNKERGLSRAGPSVLSEGYEVLGCIRGDHRCWGHLVALWYCLEVDWRAMWVWGSHACWYLWGCVSYCYCTRSNLNVVGMVNCLYWNTSSDITWATFAHLDILDSLDIPAALGNLHVIRMLNSLYYILKLKYIKSTEWLDVRGLYGIRFDTFHCGRAWVVKPSLDIPTALGNRWLRSEGEQTYPLRGHQYSNLLRSRSRSRRSSLVREWRRPVVLPWTCLVAVILSDGLQGVARWFWWWRKLDEVERYAYNSSTSEMEGHVAFVGQAWWMMSGVAWGKGKVTGPKQQTMKRRQGNRAQTTNYEAKAR